MQKDLSNELVRLKKLYELSMTISGDPVEVFRHIAKIIGELFELKIVCLSKINGDQLDFLAIYHEGQIFTDAGSCNLAITPCATVEMAQDVRIYDHVKERFPDALFLQQHNAHSYCGFPCLGNDGKVKAVTCLLDDKPRKYTEEDIEILRIFGQRIGMEIERQEHIQSVKASQQQIEFLAHHDILTELPNRILLIERFKLAIASVKREEVAVGLISLDLDHFKVVNDSFGHHAGDLLLKEVVSRLKTCVRDLDTISRQGGDQFIILLPDIYEANDVAIVAQKILEIFRNPFLIDGDSVKIAASLGIVLFPKDGNDLSQLLQYADTAMYHAKDSGGNGYQ
ncbi:MAG: sensor domain-containing diguanylate cyclase, partial [Nitrosomonas sp.]|nr:sensor domain-containing diguanylate cyclase [Nitrosomonas sp.]